MKRQSGEDFNDYRERRKKEILDTKKKILGNIRIFFSGGTHRRKERVPAFKPVLISKTVGKRHQGGSLKDFKERRRICNAKRRLREAL